MRGTVYIKRIERKSNIGKKEKNIKYKGYKELPSL